MPAFRIRVLGTLDICLENGDSISFETMKARALLAYLAVEAGKTHSRESVASLLWPDRPDSAALANLRHTLSSVRTTLASELREQPDVVSSLFNISPNKIQFNPAAGATVDLGEFEARLAAAERRGGEDLQTLILNLSAAVELYRGRFLEGFSLKGCPEFEDWVLLRRENLSLQHQKALRSLATAQELAGEWEHGLTAWRQLLQYEPWDESAHRKVMALLAAHDQRSAAIAQFENCRRILLEELGVQPEEETVRLFEQIRQGNYTQPAAPIPSMRTPPGRARALVRLVKPPRTQFVGREEQLYKLNRSLDLALTGRGQVVFITGEAGSGKTSLAWEFACQAMEMHTDLITAAGCCHAITGFEDPYLSFREMIQMLTGTIEPQPDHHLTPEHLRRLTEAFPDIIQALLAFGPELIGPFIRKETLAQRVETFGPRMQSWQREFMQIAGREQQGPPAASLAVGEQTYKPIEAFTNVLIELSRHRPLILFLDDLQWADQESVSLLHYLCKRLAGSRVLVLGAYRMQDVASGRFPSGQEWKRHPLERVQLELQRIFGEMILDLDTTGGRAFIDALIDIEPNCLGENFRQTLYHHTNGNPLFTLELLRSLEERHALVLDPSGRWVEGAPVDWDRLPARVEAVIAERIGRIAPAGQALLRAASVMGETFCAEVLARLLGLEEHQVVNWLSGPLGRDQQIVHAVQVLWTGQQTDGSPRRFSKYRFSHTLFQKFLYNRLDPVERMAQHEMTALAIESLYGPAADKMALHLARHFEQAGRMNRAVEYLLAAGKQAVLLSAPLEARAHYDSCLGLIQRMPETPERIRLEIQVQLARGAPLFATEGWGSPKAVDAVKRAIKLLEQPGSQATDPAILLALFFQIDHFNARNNTVEALARADLLLQRVSAGASPAYQVLAYAAAGQVYFFSGQPDKAAGYLEKAIGFYEREHQPFLTGMTGYNVLHLCMSWLSWSLWLLGRVGQAHAMSQQVIKLAREKSPQYYPDATIAVAGAAFYAFQGESEQAAAYAQECLRLHVEGTPRVGVILSELVLGWVQVVEGEHESGLALIERGIEQWKTHGALTMLPFSVLLHADALSHAGQTGAALEVIGNLIKMVERSERRVLEAHNHWLMGEILAREQSRRGPDWKPEPSPESCFERAIEIAQHQQARILELRATTGLAGFLLKSGRGAEGYLRLREIYRHFEGECETRDVRAAKDLITLLSGSS